MIWQTILIFSLTAFSAPHTDSQSHFNVFQLCSRSICLYSVPNLWGILCFLASIIATAFFIESIWATNNNFDNWGRVRIKQRMNGSQIHLWVLWTNNFYCCNYLFVDCFDESDQFGFHLRLQRLMFALGKMHTRRRLFHSSVPSKTWLRHDQLLDCTGIKN